MRPGRRPEGEIELGAFAQALRKPVGAADDETSRRTVFVAPLLQQGRERRAVEILAPLVEDRDHCAFGNDIGDGDRFLGAPPLDVLGATFANFDDLDFTKPEAAPDRFGAFAVVRGELAFGALLQAADCGDENAHDGATQISATWERRRAIMTARRQQQNKTKTTPRAKHPR